MSTYSPNLRLELITTGDQAGTWGNTTNTNLGTLLEAAVSGYVSVSVLSANQALIALNGADDQARNLMIALTTTTSAPFSVYAPPAEKSYVIYNATSYAATIYNSTVIGNTTAAGTGVVIPAGKIMPIWTDGTNFRSQATHLPSLSLTTPLAVTDGGTGGSTAASARTALGLGTISTQNASAVNITGGAITGITDLAIADGGTGASDAVTARTNLGLGTMATQNANSVAITGGSISGVAISGSPAFTSPVEIAYGGTGASTAAGARTNLGLGTMAIQASNNVTITGGAITGITDIAIADGGTGASDVATARSNLGVPSTTGSGASGTWGINISGNAATVTNGVYNNGGTYSINITGSAGSASTASSASNATNAANLVTSSWSVFESGGYLYFRTGGVNRMRLDSSGNLIVTGNVTAYGSGL